METSFAGSQKKEESEEKKEKDRCLDSGMPHGMICMPYAGLVDIDPHISISFRERNELIEYIEELKYPKDSEYEDKYDFKAFKSSPYDGLRQSTTKHVLNSSYPIYRKEPYLEIVNTLFVENSSLRVRNKYSVSLEDEHAAPDPLLWIKQYFEKSKMKFSFWPGKTWQRLPPSPGARIKCVKTADKFVATITHDLGGAGWPDRLWGVHCY